MTVRSLIRYALIPFALAPAGCTIGGLDTTPSITTSPAGIRVEMRLSGGVGLIGELLVVDDAGLLLHADPAGSSDSLGGRLVRVPDDLVPDVILAGTDRPAGKEVGQTVRWAEDEERDWLRSLSRFPYGAGPDIERRLLEAYGQERIYVVEAAPASPGVSEREFHASVSRETERFHDRSVAIRHGYRRVGPDFPGMGEHWVKPGLVLGGTIDPAHPQILTYVTVDGRPRLTGAAFAIPLGPDEEPPVWPVNPRFWHDHDGSIDEETLILESPHTMGQDHGGPRLAMFHVWLWPENPDGPFAQNNWALPWVRLDMSPPAAPGSVAARALSLADDGGAYYRRLLARAAGMRTTDPEDGTIRAIDGAVREAALEVEALIARSGTNDLGPDEMAALEAAWAGLWESLRRRAGPDGWAALEPAFRAFGR